MAEVNPEVRVPFGLDPVHAEMWLREEQPSEARLEELIATQPESARPVLRRLLDQAKSHIDPPEVILPELEEDLEGDGDGDEDEGYAVKTVEELKDEIRARNERRDGVNAVPPLEHIALSGTKDELIERLEADDAAQLPVAKNAAEAQASADALDAVLDGDE